MNKEIRFVLICVVENETAEEYTQADRQQFRNEVICPVNNCKSFYEMRIHQVEANSNMNSIITVPTGNAGPILVPYC